MTPYDDYYKFLADFVIEPFYNKRLSDLNSLTLNNVLKRKNPYLLKAKNLELVGDLIKSIVDAFLSSQEETVFGNLLEGFAIHVSEKLHSGFKSLQKSLDLEFERGAFYYIVGIKSGTNWGNSDQVNRMKDNFKEARNHLRVKGVVKPIVAVNGCIYGKDNNPLKSNIDVDKEYYKVAGQDFWHFISGDPNFYREIIKPIDEKAREKDETFKKAYIGKINDMTKDFSAEFMTPQSEIDWLKIIDFVSKRKG